MAATNSAWPNGFAEQAMYNRDAAIGLIVIGSVILLVAFCGSMGAAFHSKCLLSTFTIFLVLIIVSQIGVAVYVRTHASKLDAALSKAWQKAGTNPDGNKD